jgi:hypothetical protein
MTMLVNYYESGDWVGGHVWGREHAARHALSAYQQGDYRVMLVRRFGKHPCFDHRHAGLSIELQHRPSGRRAMIVIEPSARRR